MHMACHGILGYLGWFAKEAYSREPNPGLCNMLPSRNGKIVIKAKEFIRKERLAQTEDKVEYIEQELKDPTYKPASESNTEHEDDKEPVRPASLPSNSSCSEDEEQPTILKKRKTDEDEVFRTRRRRKQD